MENEDNVEEEKKVDIKGLLNDFIEEEKPELSQEEAIKAYKEEDDGKIVVKINKKRGNSDEDDENEDDEHLKRIKQELLKSLERVNELAKQIFKEEEKKEKSKIKIKSEPQKVKMKEQGKNISRVDDEKTRE